MNLRSCPSIFLLAWTGLALADFVPDDELASDPTVDLPQPEFDRGTNRIIWQDRDDNLWVGKVDPKTGVLKPTSGMGVLVDMHLARPALAGNTPRYAYGSDENAIVYSKVVRGHLHLAKAAEKSFGWEVELLDSGADRWHANGTPPETTGPAMIVYNREGPRNNLVAWRELNDPASEHNINALRSAGRFLGAEPALLVQALDDANVMQVYEVPLETGDPEQITFGGHSKQNAFVWWAPEYQDNIFTVMVGLSELAFYRRIDGVWTKFHELTIPNGNRYVSSPEAFVVNDTSYVAVVSCDHIDAATGQPRGASEVWVTGIDLETPFFRRIDDPTYNAQRMEPEPYLLDGEAVVFYTEMDRETNMHFVKRAKTGLTFDRADGALPAR
jgi:hypothetical protein